MPLRRRPNAKVACAKRDSFERFEGLPIASRSTALNCRNASAVTAASSASRSAKCRYGARCKSLAPELFDLDEYGNAHEVGDGTVPAGLEDKAWLAKSNCPEIAIEVTEE